MRYKRSTTRPYSLEEAPPVWGIGPDDQCRLAIVGEAPGREEEEKGEPFVGRAGKFLHWGLTESGIYRPGIWLTNVLSRRPPSNDIKSHEAREAIASEQEAFRNEIMWLVKEKGIKVIVAMGNTAKDAFNLKGSITKIRGSVYEFDFNYWMPVDDPNMEPCDVVIIPTFHPSYLMRARYSKGVKGSQDQSTVWLGDLDRAKEISHNGWNRPKENFILEPTIDVAREWLERAIADGADLAVDIETTGFNARLGEIVCIGLARSSSDAMVLPFITSNGRRYWLPGEEREIRDVLQSVFEQCGLYFQNALFDVSWLRRKGYDKLTPDRIKHDTLLLHHALSPELPHNLGFIVSQYGATPYWKEDFLSRDVSILQMDQIEMRRYNARDCVVLHQVIPEMLSDLKAQNNEDIYYNENLKMIEPVLQMQECGVLVDQKEMTKWNHYLDRKIKAFEHALRTLGRLPTAFSLDSRTDLRLFLFGLMDSKYEKADLLPKKKPGTKVYEELLRLEEIRSNTKPLHNIRGFNGRRTDSGLLKTDKQGRLSLQIHLQNRLSKLSYFKRWTPEHEKENSEIRKLLAWLTLYNRYTQLVKLKSTYGTYPVQEDDRIHSSYLIHGTATGRLSSRNPNLQNIPKKEIRARKPLVAGPGKQIVALDYSNLEVWVLAYETQDEVLIDILNGGKNVHDENTKLLFHLTPQDKMWGLARRAAKIFFFGGIAYGGGPREIHQKVSLEVPELALTFADYERAKRRYEDAHPAYQTWRNNIIRTVRSCRSITNAFGRTRIFYGNDRDIEKEALNFPVQSGAASIINRATIEIAQHLRTKEPRARLQAQIHDELRFEVAHDSVDWLIELAKSTMEQSVSFHGRDVSFPVDVELGPSWGDLQPKEPT